jgi:hypothetical protein
MHYATPLTFSASAMAGEAQNAGQASVSFALENGLRAYRGLNVVGLQPFAQIAFNNDGNYQPGNCCWTKPAQQQQTRNTLGNGDRSKVSQECVKNFL